MEKHDEQEITSLLTTIRAKRDLSSFGNSNQMKNGKVVNPKPIILVETTEVKPVENVQNTVTPSRDEAAGKGVIMPKKERSKLAHSKVIRSEMGEELAQFLKSAQEAEAGELYSFAHNKRHYLDDDLFQTLVLLKNTGRIRSISILVNAVVSQFLNTHQTDIEALLHKSNKRK
jgi:hypothetical protein